MEKYIVAVPINEKRLVICRDNEFEYQTVSYGEAVRIKGKNNNSKIYQLGEVKKEPETL